MAGQGHKMHRFRFAVLILAATVLQASVVEGLSIRPDLLLILMVFFSIYCSRDEAIVTSFVIGFAADIIGVAMGARIIGFGLFGTLLSYLHGFISIKRMPHQGVVIFVSGLLTGVTAHLLTLFKSQPSGGDTYTAIFWTSVCSGVVGPFLFLPTAWWMRIRTQRSGRGVG